MDIAAAIRDEMADAWLPSIYRDKVRSSRTRAYKLDIPARQNQAEIQYTLLGIELKVGRRRFACPELATARYLSVFARIGCREFALPYDISLISGIADELETSWQRSLVLLDKAKVDRTEGLARLVKAVRAEVAEIGPGEAMPLFDRETKQRKVE
ncbi:MAG TPA: hypothetical protein PLL77_12785 [Pyrinomonadaceae bacterium]|nr:hypothetical protein [Pyrinomonadaceae bacterium]